MTATINMHNSLQGVGVIIPPPEVREVLEPTAACIGKKPALEAKVLQKHENDVRFSFLKSTDPYNAYYRKRVEEERTKIVNGEASDKSKEQHRNKNNTSFVSKVPVTSKGTGSKLLSGNAQKETNGVGKEKDVDSMKTTTHGSAMVSLLKSARAKQEAARPEPREAPPDDVFTVMNVNPAPHALALDVMKLSAQFTAIYGMGFLGNLTRKEGRNSLFDFLKPLHPHFILFQRLVDSYRTILNEGEPKKQLIANIKKQSGSKEALMDEVWYMHDWECQKAEREHEATMDESEKIRSAQIDWHDFVVVETVDFDGEEETLPAPVADAKQLPRILAAAKKAEIERVRNRRDIDMDVDTEVGSVPQPKDSRVETVNVDSDIPADRIRHDVTGTQRRSGWQGEMEATVLLPSGQRVPVSKAEASMKVELKNPLYKDERARAAEKNRLRNLAGGEEVARNLARRDLAQKGSGVFNRGDLQEAVVSVPKGTIEEADARLSKAEASGPMLPMMGVDVEDVAPPAKRARVEAAVDALSKTVGAGDEGVEAETEMEVERVGDEGIEKIAGLISAEDWLRKQGTSAQVSINLPVHGNKEWKLQGQVVEITAPLKRSVAKLKGAIAKFTKLPANKQKLSIKSIGFLKDKMTLAYYNVGDGITISLEVKERGGRKRH